MGILCETLGLDAEQRQHRLELMDLAGSQHATAEHLHTLVIVPHVQALVDGFVMWLRKAKEFQPLIGNPVSCGQLITLARRNLLALGLDVDSEDYFERVLRNGMASMSAGISFAGCVAATSVLQRLLIRAVRRAVRDDTVKEAAFVSYIVRTLALEMSLTADAYDNAHQAALIDQLEAARKEEAALRTAVRRDSLTGLSSRDFALGALTDAVGQAISQLKPVSVIAGDIDQFKSINDTYGHAVGDKVLTAVGNRIRTSLRNGDLAGRMGGEEFIVVLPQTHVAGALEIAERIRQRVCAEPVVVGDLSINVTISLGVSGRRLGENAESMLQRADKALYAAKHAGRNRVMTAEVPIASVEGSLSGSSPSRSAITPLGVDIVNAHR